VQLNIGARYALPCCGEHSIKTRIETDILYNIGKEETKVAESIPLKQGLKLIITATF